MRCTVQDNQEKRKAQTNITEKENIKILSEEKYRSYEIM